MKDPYRLMVENFLLHVYNELPNITGNLPSFIYMYSPESVLRKRTLREETHVIKDLLCEQFKAVLAGYKKYFVSADLYILSDFAECQSIFAEILTFYPELKRNMFWMLVDITDRRGNHHFFGGAPMLKKLTHRPKVEDTVCISLKTGSDFDYFFPFVLETGNSIKSYKQNMVQRANEEVKNTIVNLLTTKTKELACPFKKEDFSVDYIGFVGLQHNIVLKFKRGNRVTFNVKWKGSTPTLKSAKIKLSFAYTVDVSPLTKHKQLKRMLMEDNRIRMVMSSFLKKDTLKTVLSSYRSALKCLVYRREDVPTLMSKYRVLNKRKRLMDILLGIMFENKEVSDLHILSSLILVEEVREE